MNRTSVCVALGVMATAAVAFQSANSAIVAGRKFRSSVSANADKSEHKRQMFLQTTSNKWERMKGDKDHLDSGEMWRDDVDSVAYFWKLDKAYFVSVTRSSPSGDWFHTTELAYRADGSLMYANQTCSAFSPVEGVVTREFAFSAKGKSIGTAVSGTDMEGKKKHTGQKLKELLAMEKDFGFSLKPYMNAKKLPFAKQIT